MARTDDRKLSEWTVIPRQEFCTRMYCIVCVDWGLAKERTYKCPWRGRLGPNLRAAGTLRLSMLSLNKQAYSRNCTDVTTKWSRGPRFLIAHKNCRHSGGGGNSDKDQKMTCIQLHNFVTITTRIYSQIFSFSALSILHPVQPLSQTSTVLPCFSTLWEIQTSNEPRPRLINYKKKPKINIPTLNERFVADNDSFSPRQTRTALQNICFRAEMQKFCSVKLWDMHTGQ